MAIRTSDTTSTLCISEERHDFPVGHDYEQILTCQSGHNFYFCNADSIRLRQLNSTAIGFGDISINLVGLGAFVEDPQYPQALLESISLSADVYCCSPPVLPRDCSRGFRLVYGDPVTTAVLETSPSTDSTADAPTDMTTMLTSSPPSMTSPQTGGIPALQSNDGWILRVVVIVCGVVVVIVYLGCLLYLFCRHTGYGRLAQV
ncbi:hypothetical protein BV898_00773 [Hypsibius exemplaris]|uniref:Uncharacterized protein n=1 Tax=Hypsibius exemplaris TaxID=2072580 RepID=A0A1W0XEM0_HYPEX|nr:hypothetical protein BV898_00773 [Hypsibius exemplaris]